MAWVYMLRGSTGRYYIGSTTDLDRRIEQHNHGYTYSTRRLGLPLALAASLEIASLSEVRAFERLLKAKKNPQAALFLLQRGQNLRV